MRLKRLAASLVAALPLAISNAASEREYQVPADQFANASFRVPAATDLLSFGSTKRAASERAASQQRRARPATTLVVTNCDDSGLGSLRDAIENLAVNNDTIDLTQLTCSTITLTTGAINVDFVVQNITLSGPGSHLLTIDSGAQSGYHHSAINMFGLGNLSISGVSIANATYVGSAAAGGCIWSAAAMTYLYDVAVRNCTVQAPVIEGGAAFGGGIFADGSLYMINSTISNNTAFSPDENAYGGGAFVGGSIFLKNCSIDHNRALGVGGYAGGVFALGVGQLRIVGSTVSDNLASTSTGGLILAANSTPSNAWYLRNSTVSGNVSYGVTGGLLATGPLRLSESTIAYNTAYDNGSVSHGYLIAAGLNVNGWPVTLQSSIVARNSVVLNESDISGRGAYSISGAKNLIMHSYAALPDDTINSDPMLIGLADNGGSTFTHALRMGSPAVDAGYNPDNSNYDERGYYYPRVVGGSADIGAYEREGPDFSERNALLEFYEATNGASWTKNTGWHGPEGTECHWYGVGCFPDMLHVTSLYLDLNNLTGSLPSFDGLPYLDTFLVAGNALTGTLPPLTVLPNLRRFEVRANQLTGAVPVLDGLTNLERFDISANQLSGVLPDVPRPDNLGDGDSNVCPNALDRIPDVDWDAATGQVPWYQECTGVAVDPIYADGFDGAP